MRRKLSFVVIQARQLQTGQLSKQAEIVKSPVDVYRQIATTPKRAAPARPVKLTVYEIAPLPVSSAAALSVAVAVSETDASVSLALAVELVVGTAVEVPEVAEVVVEPVGAAVPELVAPVEVAFVKSGRSTSTPYAMQIAAEPSAVTIEERLLGETHV